MFYAQSTTTVIWGRQFIEKGLNKKKQKKLNNFDHYVVLLLLFTQDTNQVSDEEH